MKKWFRHTDKTVQGWKEKDQELQDLDMEEAVSENEEAGEDGEYYIEEEYENEEYIEPEYVEYEGGEGSGENGGSGEYEEGEGSGEYEGNGEPGEYEEGEGSGEYEENGEFGEYEGNGESGEYEEGEESGEYEENGEFGEYEGNGGSGEYEENGESVESEAYYSEEYYVAEGNEGEEYIEEEPLEEESADEEYIEPEYAATVESDVESVFWEEEDHMDSVDQGEAAVRVKRHRGLGGLDLIDKLMLGTGAAVLFLAFVVAGVFYYTRWSEKNKMADLASVGAQLEGISIIGERGLAAVAYAETAKIGASVPNEKDDVKNGYDETGYDRQVSVSPIFTSIHKDLKIKFVNQKTGKLVPNVPFSVTVTDPDGKSFIWSDDDMDGIIYKKDIAAGQYQVAMEALKDSRFSAYTVSTAARSAAVKEEIVYEQVDVANEVKTEAEVNVAKEDTKQNETAVESVLPDTVAWVESRVIAATYREVSRSAIPDPVTIAMNRVLMTVGEEAGLLGGAVKAVVGTAALGARETPASGTTTEPGVTPAPETTTEPGITPAPTATPTPAPMETPTPAPGATETPAPGTTGTPVPVATATPAPDATATPAPGATGTPVPGTTETPAPGATGTPAPGATETPAPGTTGTPVPGTTAAPSPTPAPTATPSPTPAPVKGSISVSTGAVSMVVGKSAAVTVQASGFTSGKKIVYSAASGNDKVASAGIDSAGGLTIMGIGAGTAAITVTANYEGGKAETAATAVVDVTVGGSKTISLDRSSVTVFLTEPVVINATVNNALSKTQPVTAESSNTGVAQVDVSGRTVTVTGIGEGSANITVRYLENGEEAAAVCAVTVKMHPREDAETKLKDAFGNQLYVLENGTYREASHADYYKAEKFFQKGDVRYSGWQTINGRIYYFTADGDKVTGEQVIQGAKYQFASDGSLVTGEGVTGIDVSKWNGAIDWTAVKNSGVSYAIIRCGYRGSSAGKLIVDSKFEDNMKGALAANLKVGIYFYSQAVDEVEAVEEASMVLEQIRNYRISYPVFIDVEKSGGRGDKIDSGTRTAVCRAFCQTIQNAGYTAGVYSNKLWMEQKINMAELNVYKVWLAQYAAAPTYTGKYDIWQYKSNGSVSGVGGNVDLNVSYLGY